MKGVDHKRLLIVLFFFGVTREKKMERKENHRKWEQVL